VQRKLRLVLPVLLALVALTAAGARAVPRMPIGFYDDASFRWSSQAAQNLAAAHTAHASIIHALVNWAAAAPTKPANPLNANDPAYHISDIDALVRGAQADDMQVLLTITGTPAWANGGQTQNHPPTDLNTLTQFAQMLANRYNGHHAGLGAVTLWSVWNEPNLGTFLVPQYQGNTIVSPSIYAKLFMAAYKGIKAGNPNATVAAGETSMRGRDKPTGNPGQDTVAPGTFAEDLAKAAPKLPFAAWATHPYPSNFALGPTQKVAFPNVAFSTMNEFGADLQTWFKRPIPIWVTEYGEMTKPESPYLGVSYTKQAADVKTALKLAEASPYVDMFIWFILRDPGPNQLWYSGLEKANGQKKPAYAAFSSTASGMVGQTLVVKPNVRFTVTMPVPLMAVDNAAGTPIGVTYAVKHGATVVAAGQARVAISTSDAITFRIAFDPVGYADYTLVAAANDLGGQIEVHSFAVQATLGLPPYVKH
jgi:hypothetical protein